MRCLQNVVSVLVDIQTNMAKRRFIDTGDGSKPNWCPLKGLPEKKQERDVSEQEFGILGKGFEQGWNVCINEITGKTEGKND